MSKPTAKEILRKHLLDNKEEVIEDLKAMRKLSNPINDGHYIELTDRAHNLCVIMETMIGEHALIDAHPELKKHYEKMMDLAGDFYQLVGLVSETIEDSKK